MRASPVQIAPRDVRNEAVPDGGGTEGFHTTAAHAINRARLEHLASLGLSLDDRSVLEVGGDVGHLSHFFIERNCKLVTTEARTENIAEMSALYPHLDARLVDVEDDLSDLGRFDVVFCYGLLYHLENPIRALRNMVEVCDELLLIETVISDSALPILRLDDESKSATQALRGIAHRPSPSYLAMALDRIGIHNVYQPKEPPRHQDYEVVPNNDGSVQRDGHLLRSVFVASRKPLLNEGLRPLVEQT